MLTEAVADGSAAPGEPVRRHRHRMHVLAGVAAVVVVAELAVRLATGPLPEPQVWSTPELQYKVGLMEDLGPVEVALVGSSVVDVSIDPGGLDRPAFNAALGAASIGMVADVTRTLVVPRLDPDIVVIGLASRELNANSADQAEIEARFRDAPAVREAFGTESLLDRVERWAGDVSALVEYRSVLRDPDNWLGDPPEQWGPSVTAGSGLYLSFLDESYHFDETTERGLRNGALKDFRLGNEQIGTLRTLVEDLDAQGRRVLLVATPVTKDYVALHPRGEADYEAFVGALQALADEEGAAFVEAGVWGRHQFADPLHVSRAGTERLTQMVADAIAQQGWDEPSTS